MTHFTRRILPLTPRPLPLRGVSCLLVLLLWLAACGGEAGSGEVEPGGAPSGSVDDTAPSADTSVSAPDRPVAENGDLPGWSLQARSVEGNGDAATAVAARAATHDSYDRFVLEFESRVPGYTVRYPDAPLEQCGSGRPIELKSAAILHVLLRPARAHTDAGEATIGDRSMDPGLPTLEEARLICDFEGTVEWTLGLGGRAPFRVFSLESPARLVIDVRH